MEQQPKVSIIIVNHNGLEYLQNCLETISKNYYKNYEIILVDNNSKDESVDFVKKKYSEIKIIQLNDNYGFAEPNNIGAKVALGDFLYFLNNDTLLRNNSIQELVTVLSNKKIGICQSLLLTPDGHVDSSGDFINISGFAFHSKKMETSIKPILSARGASMMVKKEVFLKLGGFDPRFFASFEDVDLGWRAWISGYKVVLAPKSIVYHLGGKTSKLFESEIKFHGVKNTLILCLTNFEFSYSIKSLTFLVGKVVFSKLFGTTANKNAETSYTLPSFKIILRGTKWILKNINYVSEKRKQVNTNRVRSTKELLEMGLIKSR